MSSSFTPASLHRSGITLIELLVAIAIIGILVSIAVPAIASARESARRVSCGSQLKQIGMGCETYATISRVYPHITWKKQLLPHLGVLVPEHGDQETSLLYACPSDREHANGDHIHFSYAMNDGFGDGYHNGIWTNGTNRISPPEVVDGSAQTAAFSERLSLPWFAPQAVVWDQFPHEAHRALRRIYTDHSNLDSYYQECHSHAGDPVMQWYVTTRYHHVMPPNDNHCTLFPSQANPAPRTHYIITAGSRHPGGSHTMFCDGHVDFVSDDIDLSVWRAIGTRHGGEPESGQAF